MIGYKHCTFGSPHDQLDLFDHFVAEDRFSASCLTQRNSQCMDMQNQSNQDPLFIDRFVYDTQTLEYLNSLGQLTFPIKNKSKTQNSHITNF